MPLHLLGKKSWNVYNADNIARVRRDEAAAKAAEEAEEQRMQEVDAQRRLAILRGEVPPPLESGDHGETEAAEEASRAAPRADGHGRRKRKRVGENDTDFELRLAKERTELSVAPLESTRKPTSSAPITDRNGNIDLFGDERERAHAQKNEEAEKEKKKKQREYEDQYTMRFSNAGGKNGTAKPWYSEADLAAHDSLTKNVWGQEDPNRKERSSQRMVADDPLAMMKKGASKVRELKQERNKFQQEREAELKQLRREERHREKRTKRHGRGDRDGEPDREHRSRDRSTGCREDGSERKQGEERRTRHRSEERREYQDRREDHKERRHQRSDHRHDRNSRSRDDGHRHRKHY